MLVIFFFVLFLKIVRFLTAGAYETCRLSLLLLVVLYGIPLRPFVEPVVIVSHPNNFLAHNVVVWEFKVTNRGIVLLNLRIQRICVILPKL